MINKITKKDLLNYFHDGCKNKKSLKIGTEHEKFVFYKSNFKPIDYEGQEGIRTIFNDLIKIGWNPIYEEENIIAVKYLGQQITLEPGGQLELSGDQLDNIHDTCLESHQHLQLIDSICKKYNLGMIGVGLEPFCSKGDFQFVPKKRYAIMSKYMNSKGSHGLDMMLRTCTSQVNMDYVSEQDMIKKFRVSLALQPIATALFAYSAISEGKLSDYYSLRAYYWQNTDNDRTGILPFVFKKDFSFRSYLDYALKVPMYFVKRGDKYIDVSGESFQDFLDGQLKNYPNQYPTLDDWTDHLTTIFTEVRLKQFLEMRGADAGPWNSICSLPAFWTGILYDDESLDLASQYIENWDYKFVNKMYRNVPKLGLKFNCEGRTLLDVAKDIFTISKLGLKRRNKVNKFGKDETIFLLEIEENLKTGITNADKMINFFKKQNFLDKKKLYNFLSYRQN